MNLSVHPAELEQIALSLGTSAVSAGAVARLSLGDGLGMFVYPEQEFVIVGMGFQREAVQPSTIETVLRRREQIPERFAAWLPAQFADGSFFILQRIARTGGGMRVTSQPELDNALALLTP